MLPTKNDLPADTRKKVIDLLNARLADLIDLKLQAKQAHWNVKGLNFIALHELFDDIASGVDEHADTVAERLVAFGGLAAGTVQAVGKATTLPTYPVDISAWKQHVEAFSTAIATAGKAVRAAIATSDDLGDHGTADLFTAVSRYLDMKLWFVESHLQG